MRTSNTLLLAQAKLADANGVLDMGAFDRQLLAKTPSVVFMKNHLLTCLNEWILHFLPTRQPDDS